MIDIAVFMILRESTDPKIIPLFKPFTDRFISSMWNKAKHCPHNDFLNSEIKNTLNLNPLDDVLINFNPL